MRILLSVISFVFISQFCSAQSALLKVFDEETKQALPYSNICFEGIKTKAQHYSVTTINGEVLNEVTEESQIAISFVGYKTLFDTINPNESKTYFLKPDIFNMEQVIITATRTQKALKDAPVITQLITAKQIESGGFKTVQGVLEAEIPGIEFQRHGTSTDINMQGLEARNILILIDGERMAGETRGSCFR